MSASPALDGSWHVHPFHSARRCVASADDQTLQRRRSALHDLVRNPSINPAPLQTRRFRGLRPVRKQAPAMTGNPFIC